MSEFIIALHALVFLAHDGLSKSSEELSENLCTNSVRIRKVMSLCKKNGLVETKSGVNGGYMIGKDGKNINLKQIYEAVDITLLESKWHSGNIESDCPYCAYMGRYVDGLFSYINKEAFSILEKITIADVENDIKKMAENR
ncbi:RrF2 family transcriptional regulator [Peptostreptococcus equinus]|uniref:Rrf2 family transcriptional regulator n=1 Tax=Peptostreptococcus equinus TaxID=3003601 RepID=A0ABY7JRC9_9FIRM|nr:Rrf2 family transcriptional regulator [Peptostreptococcus sp. CBA3647]WAW15411.1 Rrf2 family transcriptional regulator [Peptostreptococcus sp. CBA3647]